jgi:hypothetical protein
LVFIYSSETTVPYNQYKHCQVMGVGLKDGGSGGGGSGGGGGGILTSDQDCPFCSDKVPFHAYMRFFSCCHPGVICGYASGYIC